MGRPLPVLEQVAPRSVLRPDGKRTFVVPADVKGRFTRLRRVVFAVLIAVYAVLPWLHIDGHPAVFLDIEHRAFYLFGATFNAQDVWMAFFLVSGAGFALIVLTALLGRVWCGYACPQTVFLDGVYRRIERWIEGPRNARLQREQQPISWQRTARKLGKHGAFVVVSFLLAHVFLSYFVSMPGLLRMISGPPAEHPEAFAWAIATTLVLYVNFAWFREQLCLVICPYGRLQSVLTDSDTLVIGYDTARGEPRGKAKAADRGHCVDCARCVVVCPTGIDIRNGLQLDCIGCAACVDACDAVMDKLGRPRGLVRYDSLNGLQGKAGRFLRPRVYVYAALGALGVLVAALSLRAHEAFEANLLRLSGAPFVLEAQGERVRNALELHLVNKRGEQVTFQVVGQVEQDMEALVALPRVTLGPFGAQRIPVFVTAPNDGRGRTVQVKVDDGHKSRVIQAPFVAPRSAP